MPVMLTLAVALVGCTLIPAYRRPAAPVPAQFPPAAAADPASAAPAAQNAPPSSSPAAELPVREFFADPQLQALLQLALQNNRDLRVAVLNVAQSRAQYRISRAALLPTLQGSGGFTREATSLGAEIPGFPSNATFVSSLWSASVGVSSYELDLFGAVRSQTAQGLEQYFATEEAQRAARVSLVGEVATQYFTLRAAEEQLKLAQDTLESVRGSYELNRATFAAGASNELDLRQAEGQVETAELAIRTYQLQVAQARDALQLLLGSPLPAAPPSPLPFDEAHMMSAIPAGLPSDLLEQRPDILQAEHTLKAANANIGVARAELFPTISLTSSIGTVGAQLSSLFKAGSGQWSFAPQITVPIFTGGKNRAQLDAARVGERIQVANYEKAIQSAFREVADALAETDNYAQQVRLEAALVVTERRRLELATLRYQHGEDSYLNELTAQQDLYSAQQGLLQARFNRLSSQVALYQALGGGWK
ncbi:MAG TPA: efflux transporter outer membrane subunit [Steroidobacteraceae bacterium]|nr:efflux transporter outer membrane subunit [Steroidobacteraceae bacterium]